MECNKILLTPKPRISPKLRLLCLPYAGGSAATYMPWIESFCEEIELVLFQPAGRSYRLSAPPHDDMTSLVDELFDHASYITHAPYVVFGHSLGSRVAYELVCRFQSSGLSLPRYFIASGSRAPHLPNKRASICNLPHKAFIGELEKLSGTPKEILTNPELLELLLPALRADFRIAETYQAEPVTIKTPILVLHGKYDNDIEHNQAAAWSELSQAESTIENIPGNHFFINHHRSMVIDKVKSVLNKVLDLTNTEHLNTKNQFN
jgi:surfactin synthase thioesterase subunit